MVPSPSFLRAALAYLVTPGTLRHYSPQAGEYEATLLVGDPSTPKGISYALGTAELLFSGASNAPEPAAAVRTAKFQPANNVKPDITHIFVSQQLGGA